MEKFQVGTKVRVRDDAGSYCDGLEGVVVGHFHDEGLTVSFPGVEGARWYSMEALTLAKE